jgi:hypothetical protein
VPFLALTPFLAAWILTVGAFVLHDVIDNDIVPNLPTREALLYCGTLAGLALDLWLKCREPRQAHSSEATP